MDDVKKGWILGGILLIVIVIAFSFGIFWKNNPESVSEYFESVVDSVKEIIGMEDSKPLNDNVESNNKPNETVNSSSEVTSISGGGGGGGGGGGSGGSGESTEGTTTPSFQYTGNETFLSLEELFNYGNPIGNKVIVEGIAFEITGVSMSDYFFFTDDSRVMNDPNYMLFNEIDYHITVYNSPSVVLSQSIITVTGIIVDCEQNDDGTYCINAESIE